MKALDWIQMFVAAILITAAAYLFGSLGQEGTPHHALAVTLGVLALELLAVAAVLICDILSR